jgi:hypothetical protein
MGIHPLPFGENTLARDASAFVSESFHGSCFRFENSPRKNPPAVSRVRSPRYWPAMFALFQSFFTDLMPRPRATATFTCRVDAYSTETGIPVTVVWSDSQRLRDSRAAFSSPIWNAMAANAVAARAMIVILIVVFIIGIYLPPPRATRRRLRSRIGKRGCWFSHRRG